jgi:hypothetical protein
MVKLLLLKRILNANANPAACATFQGLSSILLRNYQELKKRRIEESFLRPWLGADFAGFAQLITHAAASQPLQQVLGMIMQHNLQLDVMLAGVDANGAHLAVVTHPGTLAPFDTVGYFATGSGGIHATVRLSIGRQNGNATLVETVHSVYQAKLAAEASQGVGKFTDIAVLNEKGVCFVKSDVFGALSAMQAEAPTPKVDDLQKLKDVCKEYEHELPQ